MSSHNLEKNIKELNFGDDVEKIKDAFTHAASNVKNKTQKVVNESLENVKSTTSNVEGAVSDYVQENPLKSVIFAILAGVLFSKLL